MGEKGLDEVILAVGSIIADLDFYSYYQLLEVDQDASTDVINFNYNVRLDELERARKDPHCNERLAQDIGLVLRRMREAQRVLCDRRLRMEYDQGLELGEIRHQPTVDAMDAASAGPAKPRPAAVAGTAPDKQDDEYLETVTSGLERKLGQDLLHSGPSDDEIEDVPEPVDREHLQRLTDQMRFKLARAGVDFTVNEGFEGLDDLSGIDPEFLEEAVSDLEQKLGQLGVDTDEEGEAEDRSADAEFAAGLVENLQQELAGMGLDMFSVAEVVDEAPDEDLLDEQGRPLPRPELVAPPPRPKAPPRPQPAPLPEDLRVDAERLMTRREQARTEPETKGDEETFHYVIQLSPEEAGPVPPEPRTDAVPGPVEGDAVPLLRLELQED